MSQFTIIGNGKIFLRFVQKENGLLLNSVSSCGEDPVRYDGFLPFVFCPLGESNGTNGGDVSLYKQGLGNFQMQAFERSEDALSVCYSSKEYGVRVECTFTLIDGAVRIRERVYAEREITFTDFYPILPLTHFEPTEGEKYLLSYRKNKWQGEGQWKSERLTDLDFTDYYRHSPLNYFSVQSYGSQTTGEYYPSLLLSSKSENWLLEGVPTGSWLAALTQWRGICQTRGVLLFSFACTEERKLHSVVRLAEGECYQAADCVLCVGEKTENAIQALYEEKRANTAYRIEKSTVVFNDYMNCLWAKPTWEKEKPLIDLCKRLGVDYYVIDDGWFLYREEVGRRLGDWNTDGDALGVSLQALFDYIKESGMKVGIWLEPEVVGENSCVYKAHRDWLLTVDGKTYGTSARYFLDFRKGEVKEYLTAKIKALYDMGARYFKLDYNDSYFRADGGHALTALQENYLQIKGFYASLQKEFSDAIFENCASGGKRSDSGILSAFHLQSVSDQEEYFRYPSILTGSLVNNLPERTGVWCMPYPVGFYRQNEVEKIEYPIEEEIIFNLVNAMTGVFTLSSRIDLLREEELSLIAEGVKVYREIYPLLRSGYPAYPLGFTGVNGKRHALSFVCGDKELLYLWSTGEKEFPIPQAESYRQLYPKKADSTITKDKITLKTDYSARIFYKER